jgi:hypothetical protein
MAKNFNADFYVTSATVIPVLFLAVAVQGRVSEGVERSWMAMQRDPYASQPWMRWIKKWALVYLWFAVPVILVFSGFIGEFGALSALYRGSEDPGQRADVFIATLILVFIVALGPLHVSRPKAIKRAIDEHRRNQRGGLTRPTDRRIPAMKQRRNCVPISS